MAEQGATAYGEKRYADAVDLFTRAEALFHSPVHLLYVARANTALGRLVKAQEAYIKIVRAQLEPGSPEAFKRAVADADTELEKLKPRIPQVTLRILGADGSSPEVYVDGEPVPPVLVGVAMPIDPGKRTFEVRAAGRLPAERTVVVEEGEASQVELELAPAPDETAATPVSTAVGDTTVIEPASDDQGALRIGAWVGVGVGAVGVGLGTWFLVDKLSIETEADDLAAQCSRPCPDAQRLVIDGRDQAAADAGSKSLIGYAVGGIGIAAGVTLFVLSSDDSDSATAPSFTPWVGLGQAGVRGRF
jgi:hypothetical protein